MINYRRFYSDNKISSSHVHSSKLNCLPIMISYQTPLSKLFIKTKFYLFISYLQSLQCDRRFETKEVITDNNLVQLLTKGKELYFDSIGLKFGNHCDK